MLSSALIGALTLVDPARLSPGQRLLHRGALAGLAGATTLLEVRAAPSYGWEDPLGRAGLPVGAAGLMLGMAEVNELGDRSLHGYLRRHGVRRPRLLMAGCAAAFSLAAFAVGRGAGAGPELEEETPALQVVPDDIRGLVLRMLQDEESYSSRELQAQLDGAQARVWPAELGFASVIELTVADDVSLAVPHTFTFPVKARLTGDHGEPLQVTLNVEDGLLSTLVLDRLPDAEGEESSGGHGVSGDGLDGEDGEEEPVDLTEQRWPRAEEITLVHDSHQRRR